MRMHTIKHQEPGYFPTPPGTCFLKPDLPLADGSKPFGNNWHPFIVVHEGDDFVECVMGRTLTDPARGRDDSWKLEKIAGAVEITDPCPPMEPTSTRRQYVDASQIIVIPKAELYESTNLELCSNYGVQLSSVQTTTLKQAAREHINDRFASYADPYDMDNKDYPVDQYQSESFAWVTNSRGFPIKFPTANRVEPTVSYQNPEKEDEYTC